MCTSRLTLGNLFQSGLIINHLFSYWPHMCTGGPWLEVWVVAYGNNCVTTAPAARLKLAVVLDGLVDEKRTFQNGAEIVGTLQQELPVIDVEQSFISSLSRAPTAPVDTLCKCKRK